MPRKVKSFLAIQKEKLKEQQRKKLEQQKSRIDIIKENIEGLNDPEDIMLEILGVLTEVEVVPDVGGYYTFVYNAKTPGLIYDQHPLIAVFDIQSWGFKGYNFHWEELRNYTWQEVAGNLHVVNNDEISEMRNIKYAKFLRK